VVNDWRDMVVRAVTGGDAQRAYVVPRGGQKRINTPTSATLAPI
jgi:hypothetical protein